MSVRQHILRMSLGLCWLSILSPAQAAEPQDSADADLPDDDFVADAIADEAAEPVAAELLFDDVDFNRVNTVETVDDETDSSLSVSSLETGLRPALEPEPTIAVPPLAGPVMAFDGLTVFPVGLNVGDRNIVPTTLIKGTEAGEAIAFSRWLIPFDSAVQALSITVSTLETGEWELRSPGFVIRLSPEELTTDDTLGLVLSVQQIETLLGVPTQFDQLDYAVRFDPPWAGDRRSRQQTTERPIITEGLPLIQPDELAISGFSQTVRVAGSSDSETTTSGNISSLGTAFGGSWYARAEQPSVTDADSWRLSELQYLRQSDAADIALGSQPTFWRSQNRSIRSGNGGSRRSSGSYWGATYVQRWGFDPASERGTGGFSPRQRLQAAEVGRTIAGEAEPGTLAQLTQGLQSTVVDEVLVDSSGLYRFENVVSGRGGSYQVLLYPNGQLTALPDVRTARFSALPGQLPAGGSALLVSAGINRQATTNFLGDFSDFRGGVAYQRGISEDLTVGVGFVQDQNPQALTEAFFAPSNLPLKVAVSALTDMRTAEVDVTADVQYRPSRKVYMGFNSDRFSQRFNAEWRVAKGVTLLARGNTRDDAVAGGARFAVNNRDFFLFGNATLDTKSRLRWNLSSRLGSLGLRHFGNENTTQSELFYSLSGNYAYGDGHGVLLNYETRDFNGTFNQLGTASWRYLSAQRTGDGRHLWDAQVGYGMGSLGSGMVATVSTAVLPGVEVQARYQGVSAVSDRNTFQLEFRPRLAFNGGLNQGIRADNQHQDRLRTQGGLLIQPYFDENANGKRENGEPLYRDNLDLLLSVNYEDLRQYRPDIRESGAFLTLAPDMYRVDLDPAGYPLNWQAAENAYAVSTTAGQYTKVEIPLTRAYTLIGTVTDGEGKALAGQRVESISTGSGDRQISVTNAAGVFYLDNLSQGTHRFEMGGEPVDDTAVTLTPQIEGLQEINFRMMADGIRAEIVSPQPISEEIVSEENEQATDPLENLLMGLDPTLI